MSPVAMRNSLTVATDRTRVARGRAAGLVPRQWGTYTRITCIEVMRDYAHVADSDECRSPLVKHHHHSHDPRHELGQSGIYLAYGHWTEEAHRLLKCHKPQADLRFRWWSLGDSNP